MSSYVAESIAVKVRNSLLEALGSNLAAIWLYGASVFEHPLFDVDLHVLVRHQLTSEEWKVVENLHEDLVHNTPLDPDGLDFWYILLNDARGTVSPRHLAPWCNGLVDRHWALHRAHWLAGRCKVIYGVEPSSVVQPPAWEELKNELMEELREGEPNAYWVLQLCRVWASLATRNVVRSKLDSGGWAMESLATEHHGIVRSAIRYYERKVRLGDEALIKAYFPIFLREVRRQIESRGG